MPVHQGEDNKGSYYQYGNQKKYYYYDEKSRKKAEKKAIIQGYAIRMSEERHDKNQICGINHYLKYLKYLKYKNKYYQLLNRIN